MRNVEPRVRKTGRSSWRAATFELQAYGHQSVWMLQAVVYRHWETPQRSTMSWWQPLGRSGGAKVYKDRAGGEVNSNRKIASLIGHFFLTLCTIVLERYGLASFASPADRLYNTSAEAGYSEHLFFHGGEILWRFDVCSRRLDYND